MNTKHWIDRLIFYKSGTEILDLEKLNELESPSPQWARPQAVKDLSQ